jgi:uncharacterized damage-inducible protein DinB
MTSSAGRRLRGRAAGKRGGKKKKRATAKRRARARVRASRPKQKPRRTPKARSRARRSAKTSGTKRATGAARSRATKRAIVTTRKARSGLRAVPARKRRAARPAPAPAFPQTVGAPARSQLMFRMVKARASVLAAVQGLGAAAAERPHGEGKWNTRETLLHLVTRDRARLREMEAALRGVRPSWEGWDPERQARVNEEDLAPLRSTSWDDTLKLLLITRQELMEAVESIPEEPAEVWGEEHPLGWMFQRLPAHDLHHAESIKRWRTEQGA